MGKKAQIELDFVIDKWTNSTENVNSGDSFPTEVSLLAANKLKNITKIKGWKFNWKGEFKLPEREVYKLTISNNPNIIQGLVSLEIKADHVYMHLIESAPLTLGRTKHILAFPQIW